MVASLATHGSGKRGENADPALEYRGDPRPGGPVTRSANRRRGCYRSARAATAPMGENPRCGPTDNERASDANRHGRARTHGSGDGAAPLGRRSPLRGLRPSGRRRAGSGGPGSHRRQLARGSREEAREAACRLSDDPGRARRCHGRRAGSGARSRRRHDRRRQLGLPRRHRPRRATAKQTASLRGHGDERRRLGCRARLLLDDRGRARGGEAPRPGVRDAVSRARQHPAHARPRKPHGAPPRTATCTAVPPAPVTS